MDAPVAADKRSAAGPYILSCPHCSWTSLEADLIFDYRVNISGQMAEALKQRKVHQVGDSGNNRSPPQATDPPDHFRQLAEFYKAQIEESNPATPFRSRYAKTPGYRDFSGLRRQTRQLPVMREAQTPAEGVRELPNYHSQSREASSEGTQQTYQDVDDRLISQMANLGWSGTTSLTQQIQQAQRVHLTTQLLPTATLLHTRRAKRCRTCKHNLLRPADPRSSSNSSSASTSSRYRIRQLASSYIPRLTIRPLALKDPNAPTTSSTPTVLKPGKATHYLLTFHNPLYHALRITLASPRFTPGPTASKTTILCPSFEVAANRDIWDDAGTASTTSSFRSAIASKSTIALKDATGYQQPEAGKVWASERNATTIVVEIVPGIIERGERESTMHEDVLKVPVFVRLEYDTTTTPTSATSATMTKPTSTRNVSFATDADHDVVAQVDTTALEEDARIAGLSGADVVNTAGAGDDGRRELAYWCVLDYGRQG